MRSPRETRSRPPSLSDFLRARIRPLSALRRPRHGLASLRSTERVNHMTSAWTFDGEVSTPRRSRRTPAGSRRRRWTPVTAPLLPSIFRYNRAPGTSGSDTPMTGLPHADGLVRVRSHASAPLGRCALGTHECSGPSGATSSRDVRQIDPSPSLARFRASGRTDRRRRSGAGPAGRPRTRSSLRRLGPTPSLTFGSPGELPTGPGRTPPAGRFRRRSLRPATDAALRGRLR